MTTVVSECHCRRDSRAVKSGGNRSQSLSFLAVESGVASECLLVPGSMSLLMLEHPVPGHTEAENPSQIQTKGGSGPDPCQVDYSMLTRDVY